MLKYTRIKSSDCASKKKKKIQWLILDQSLVQHDFNLRLGRVLTNCGSDTQAKPCMQLANHSLCKMVWRLLNGPGPSKLLELRPSWGLGTFQSGIAIYTSCIWVAYIHRGLIYLTNIFKVSAEATQLMILNRYYIFFLSKEKKN